MVNENSNKSNNDDMTPTITSSFQALQEQVSRMNLHDDGKENNHLDSPQQKTPSQNNIKVKTNDVITSRSLPLLTPVRSSPSSLVVTPPLHARRGMKLESPSLEGGEEIVDATNTTNNINRKRVRCCYDDPPMLPESPEFISNSSSFCSLNSLDDTTMNNISRPVLFERPRPLYSPVSRVSTTTAWNMNFFTARRRRQQEEPHGDQPSRIMGRQSRANENVEDRMLSILNAFPVLEDEEQRVSSSSSNAALSTTTVSFKIRKRKNPQEEEELRLAQLHHDITSRIII
jgi:hypothetical protein